MAGNAIFEEVAQTYENAEVVDIEGEAKASGPEGVGAREAVSFGTDLYITLYQPIDRERRIYRPSTIQKSHEQKKVELRDGKGRRVFFRESELPQGWREENPRDEAKYRCPVQGCPKLLPSAKSLRDHMMGFHERQFDGIYKDEVNELVKKELRENGAFEAMVIKREEPGEKRSGRLSKG